MIVEIVLKSNRDEVLYFSAIDVSIYDDIMTVTTVAKERYHFSTEDIFILSCVNGWYKK